MDYNCLDCKRTLIGRSDKKFCNDACRSNYNNKRNYIQHRHIRSVNSILKKNRNILAALNPYGKKVVAKEKLLENGFNFHYFTNLLETSKGRVYFFCYEYGYLIIDDQEVLLVVQNSRY
ncbi:hypothetical protein H8S90_25350 [Olivibacter sp. SDN3]|uniref:hypothetical protein n=1 Tax=Olivibacter sp. SDN3 TaxID=2764720 RepID=UPI00165176C1|nr:hypothetical protein [Olivibacter sp. SDN3]QNL49971.1 hypothetical protein H8S90_25350 [Olivibacter sp. SDN3]